MYHGVTPRIMWEVEPTLYWRVKIDGKWTYKKARWASNEIHKTFMVIAIEYPKGGE